MLAGLRAGRRIEPHDLPLRAGDCVLSDPTLTDRQFLRLELVKVAAAQCSPGYVEARVKELETFVLEADAAGEPPFESPFGELVEVTSFGTPAGERHFADKDGRLVIVRDARA